MADPSKLSDFAFEAEFYGVPSLKTDCEAALDKIVELCKPPKARMFTLFMSDPSFLG